MQIGAAAGTVTANDTEHHTPLSNMLVDLTHCNFAQGMQQDKEAMQQLKQQLSTLQSSEAESKAWLRRNLDSEKSSHQQVTQLRV